MLPNIAAVGTLSPLSVQVGTPLIQVNSSSTGLHVRKAIPKVGIRYRNLPASYLSELTKTFLKMLTKKKKKKHFPWRDRPSKPCCAGVQESIP
jgi:hypothetical protein